MCSNFKPPHTAYTHLLVRVWVHGCMILQVQVPTNRYVWLETYEYVKMYTSPGPTAAEWKMEE
jgi:hypothetical protein